MTDERKHRDGPTAEVLAETVSIVEREGVPYLMIGGIASATWGEPKPIRDIDLFVRESDARRTLDAFARAGFQTEEADPEWLLKAVKHDVLVDVIYNVNKQVCIDDEMLERGAPREVEGTKLRVLAPEDLVVALAISNKDDTDYWYDALSVLARNRGLDWPYLLRRAEAGPERVLSLLLYARADGIAVPDAPVRALAGRVLGEAEPA